MMKELKLDNVNSVEAITSQLWSVFDVLRGSSVSSEDYHLILFLLTLYKDGHLIDAVKSTPNDIRYSIKDIIRKSNAENYHQIIEISGAFDHALERLSSRAFQDIVRVLLSINIDELKLHFSDIFDNVLYRLAKSQGRHGGEFIQPIELSRLVWNLADLDSNATVFNPFAGAASFGVLLTGGQSYYGQEINYTTWAIGALRILAYKRSNESKYVKDDSILNWPLYDQKFDLVVSNPPIGLRLVNNYSEVFPGYRTAEQLLIEKGIDSLKYKGKLIAILPNGFLFRGGSEQRLREKLVESDLVESIIALPGGLLPNTGMPLAILVLNKAKRMPGVVKFIDAKNYVELKGSREKRLNDYALISDIKIDQESDSVRIVSNNQIMELEYNLSVPRYFQKNFEGVKLFDILEYVRGSRDVNIESGKLIRIRDLKDDKLDYFLDESSVKESDLKRPDIRVIADSVLLLAIRWRTLKPTFFQYTGTPILLPNDIIAFKVNESVVNIGYLVNELHADYVQEQLDSCRSGNVVPALKREDLLNIKIALPLINEQKAKLQGVIEALADEKKKEYILFNRIHGLESDIQNQNNFLRHSIAGNLSNLRGAFNKLKNILMTHVKTSVPELLMLKESESSELNLERLMVIIERDIEKISNDTQRNYLGANSLNNAVLEPVEIISFLESFTWELQNIKDLGYTIVFSYTKDDFIDESGNIIQVFINGNRDLLTDMLNNVLENAEAHAFIMKDRQKNFIDILLTRADDKSLTISIMNSGKTFPEDLTYEMFATKGSRAGANAGDGFGGWYIDQIAKKLNGKIDIIDEQGGEGIGGIWATSIEITFPILNFESNEEI